MSTENEKAPTRAPMTLAELRAVSAIMSPAQAGNLSPVFALVELYATRANKTLLQVWEMAAVEAVSAMVEMLPDILTTDMQQAAGEASMQIGEQLNPKVIREKLMQRLRLVA